IGVLLATGAAALSAVVTLIVKQLTKTESPTTIVTFMVLLMTPMALPLAIWVWQAPAPIDWLWILLMGVCGSAGHICLVRAFALADASVVMNYDYTRMVFATMIGWIAFGEFPDLWTWVGSGVI
ncbi:MAG TPA: DMT family transporter, partial [Alphaproteobacteria bacterium]|nr:DMT family transporter [Alphaproteobacteria bacterium]